MSPAPARTSRPAIVAAARTILEERGLEAVTMATVAASVGVRPPSLYKHVRDRSELLGAMVADAADELTAVLHAAGGATDVPGAAPGDASPAGRITAIADAYRTFVRRSPRAAALLFADLGPDLPAPQAKLALAVAPVLDAVAALVGPDRALPAARTLTAFVHGFTSMEVGGAFRLGGDIDEAYRTGVAAIVSGLGTVSSTAPPVRRG